MERAFAGATGSEVNELLQEFQRGYPVWNLRRLLGNPQEAAVKAGAWIASELGSRIAPLMSDLAPLLQHQSREVRFFVLDAVLVGATPEHGDVIARAMELMEDPDEAVRWKALHLISRATVDQLRAGLVHLENGALAASVHWLLNMLAAGSATEITAAFDDNNPVKRLAAAAAAARLADINPSPLESAARASDPEVSSFAREELAKRSLRP